MADARLADEPWEFADRCFVITGASSGLAPCITGVSLPADGGWLAR